MYCDGCNCVTCHNNVENEAARREAVEATLERNPNAFRPKIASSPHGTRNRRVCVTVKLFEDAFLSFQILVRLPSFLASKLILQCNC